MGICSFVLKEDPIDSFRDERKYWLYSTGSDDDVSGVVVEDYTDTEDETEHTSNVHATIEETNRDDITPSKDETSDIKHTDTSHEVDPTARSNKYNLRPRKIVDYSAMFRSIGKPTRTSNKRKRCVYFTIIYHQTAVCTSTYAILIHSNILNDLVFVFTFNKRDTIFLWPPFLANSRGLLSDTLWSTLWSFTRILTTS
jgi:hypothetical protein